MEKREVFIRVLVSIVFSISTCILFIAFYFGFNGISFELFKDLLFKAGVENRIHSWIPLIFPTIMIMWPFFILLSKNYSFSLRLGLTILCISPNFYYLIFPPFTSFGLKQDDKILSYLILVSIAVAILLFVDAIKRYLIFKKECRQKEVLL